MTADAFDPEYHRRGFFGRLPSRPHDLYARVTPTQQAIVLCHMGIPRISAADWRLHVGGLVDQPMCLTFDDILSFEKQELQSVHQCAGSPLQPDEPSQRVCNVVWGGILLSYVLKKAKVRPEANFLWSQGADSGRFGNVECGPYIKDLPLPRVDVDVMLAYEMNGESLLPEHGFPVRLVVPGYYGTNSVKWLQSITLATSRAASPFTQRWYLDPDERGNRTIPVWQTAPQSVIVAPCPGELLAAKEPMSIWGWAWGDEIVERVDISLDGGLKWEAAALEPEAGHAWRRFSFDWHPVVAGSFRLISRATAQSGAVQPVADRRNAMYEVEVVVDP